MQKINIYLLLVVINGYYLRMNEQNSTKSKCADPFAIKCFFMQFVVESERQQQLDNESISLKRVRLSFSSSSIRVEFMSSERDLLMLFRISCGSFDALPINEEVILVTLRRRAPFVASC
mmetsp:Transcript_26678/g.36689  ORF Transcript_26678/g.36689 Transcript_26678/m.36689 type:complete len:119 (-) Transcript_26678:277-633(-)